MRLIIFLLISLLCAPSAMAAQASAEEVAKQHNELYFAGNFREAYALRDPSQFASERKGFDQLLQSRPGAKALMREGKTDAELDQLSDRDYIIWYMTTFMARAAKVDSAADLPPQTARAKVLGSVKDGDDTVYVVCKMTVTTDGRSTETIDLVRVVKIGSQWRVTQPRLLMPLDSPEGAKISGE